MIIGEEIIGFEETGSRKLPLSLKLLLKATPFYYLESLVSKRFLLKVDDCFILYTGCYK